MYQSQDQRQFARKLRRDMTDAERKLWSALRCEQLAGLKFRRQAAIEQYVVDFVCFSIKLVIEVDGGQHNTEEGREHDNLRTRFLESRGFRVLRFWNSEVLEDVEAVIASVVKQCELETPPTPPSPNPSPQGGGG